MTVHNHAVVWVDHRVAKVFYLGLDAVDLALTRLAANPATASAVPALRSRLAQARKTVAASGTGQHP